MGKKEETTAAAFANSPVFAFGLDENGKPRGARFSQGLNDQIVSAALDMNCRVIQNHSAALTALGMKLPVGRVYASGKAFIPNIRRDLYDKLEAARQQPPEEVGGVIPVSLFKEPSEPPSAAGEPKDKAATVACASPMASGLPKSWETIASGHMVLAFEGPGEGWWEAVVVHREEEILTLRYRDYPKVPNFQRHITTVALINPGPA
jgi:hypothetical protein